MVTTSWWYVGQAHIQIVLGVHVELASIPLTLSISACAYHSPVAGCHALQLLLMPNEELCAIHLQARA